MTTMMPISINTHAIRIQGIVARRKNSIGTFKASASSLKTVAFTRTCSHLAEKKPFDGAARRTQSTVAASHQQPTVQRPPIISARGSLPSLSNASMSGGQHQHRGQSGPSAAVRRQDSDDYDLFGEGAVDERAHNPLESKEKNCSTLFDLPTTAAVDVLVKQYAEQKPTSVSLATLLQTAEGKLLGRDKVTREPPYCTKELTESQQVLLQIASFIQRELPVRLAHRIVELDEAPFLSKMPSVKIVKDTYLDSFTKILQFPQITSLEKEEEFSHLLESLYENHSHVLLHMARGAFELRKDIRAGKIKVNFDARKEAFRQSKYLSSCRSRKNSSFDTMQELHEFLDRFYTSRIGIRVLAGQYLALRKHPPIPGYIGMICLDTSPHDCVQEAIDDAIFICQKRYGAAPNVNIRGCLDLTFPYIKAHLHYIVLELIKNSMRATVEYHGEDKDEDEWPEINVIISDGKNNEDVVIKISDEGGGIPRSFVTQKIWSYLFTTADSKIQEGMLELDSSSHGTVDHGIDSPIAGLGYGLPISRSYARYFGGDIEIMSMEGHGTDAFVYLRRLGDSCEPHGT